MVEKACKKCRMIISESSVCPNCGSSELTEKWNSYILVFNPTESELAKKIDAKTVGKYAIKIKG